MRSVEVLLCRVGTSRRGLEGVVKERWRLMQDIVTVKKV